MKRYNVAILGATGAVGEQMIRVLWERRFPIGGLRLLSSERSAGGRMDTPFGNAELGLACETAFEGADIVLGIIPAPSGWIRTCPSWCRR